MDTGKKKKSKRKAISIALLAAFTIVLVTAAGCSNKSVDKFPVEIKTLSEAKTVDVVNLRGIGSISVKQSIIIAGVERDLFCTFDDPVAALAGLQDTILDYLSFLQQEYDLKPLTLRNLDMYYEKMYVYEQYLIDNNHEDELEAVREESKVLASFYRIYHLDDKNKEVIKRAHKSLSAEDLDYLMQLLPAFAPQFT